MHQYRIFRKLSLFASRAIIAIAALSVAFVAAELARLYLLLRRIHPVLANICLGIGLLVMIILVVRFFIARRHHGMLRARNLRLGDQSTHKHRIKLLQHLVDCGKRLANQRLIPREQSKSILQICHDLEDLLHHHPLNDDLDRATRTAREKMIAPLFATLDEISIKITRSKALAVIEDTYYPPLPLFTPVVVFYHVFTLISEITDIYLPRPSLLEYVRVMQDVWSVMNKGHFARKGRHYFSAIEQAKPSVITDDLSHAFSLVWLIHVVASIATQRCRTLHDWNLNDAVEEMNSELINCLRLTCNSFTQGAIPMLKKRMHRYAPAADLEAKSFAEDVTASVTRSLEGLTRNMSVASASMIDPSSGNTSMQRS